MSEIQVNCIKCNKPQEVQSLIWGRIMDGQIHFKVECFFCGVVTVGIFALEEKGRYRGKNYGS
jgi:hypothetical protein